MGASRPAAQFSIPVPATITVLLFCEFPNQLKAYKGWEILKDFQKLVKTRKREEHLQINPGDKRLFYILVSTTAIPLNAEIKIGLFIVNDYLQTMPRYHWFWIDKLFLSYPLPKKDV